MHLTKVSYSMSSMKVGLVHYRVGRTDGVSLEVAKRKEILEEMGHDVHLIAGHFSNGPDFIIPELEADMPEVVEIKENAWAHFNKQTLSPEELMQRIDDLSDRIKQAFLKYYEQEKFDILLVHNIFSYSLHLPAAKAFAEIVEEYDIPVIATNHDYYWERTEYLDTTSAPVREFVNKYIPFKHERIKYVSINSIADLELIKRRGIKSDLLGDFLDFSHPHWNIDDYNKDFLKDINVKENDLVVLQATRIVRRKGIEMTVDVVRELNRRKKALIGQTLYNGKKITEDSNIVLVLSGFTEQADQVYRKDLERKIKQAGIEARFINDKISATRKPGPPKVYSLWDSYAHADFVTYPSLFEGWGNQFIEAVFAQKPIVLFEYPVFKTDIKAEGYDYISLGDELSGTNEKGLVTISRRGVKRTVASLLNKLTSPDTNTDLEKNYEIGRKFHDNSLLKKYLESTIEQLVTKHAKELSRQAH